MRMDEKLELVHDARCSIKKNAKVFSSFGMLGFHAEDKYFASSRRVVDPAIHCAGVSESERYRHRFPEEHLADRNYQVAARRAVGRTSRW